MADPEFTCEMLTDQILNDAILSILRKSFRDGVAAPIWMNREIMIAVWWKFKIKKFKTH